MITVPVRTRSPYEIRIGKGLLDEIGTVLAARFGIVRVVVVTDHTVEKLYGGALISSLTNAGLKAETYVFPSGEVSKNFAVLESLLHFLAQREITRADIVLALGGGVTGDLAGFAAAIYMRGIRFVQIPTTLLAAVDSSVGGKTAINLGKIKNLVGAFHQPSFVLCDTDLLASLPTEIIADGMAEVIKYGLLGDKELIGILQRAFSYEEIIARCVRTKAELVSEDEKDVGRRRLLNYGHTVGHAVERLSDFTIAHGHAVAIGMAVMSRAAAAHSFCDKNVPLETERLLRLYNLPTHCPYRPDAIAMAAADDKKRSGDSITVIVPRGIGITEPISVKVTALVDFLRTGI